MIVDSTTTDADVLNLTITAAPGTAPTISGVETINLNDKFGNAVFTATGVSNGTIVASSTYGNTASVTGVDGSKGLSVKAGSNVTTLNIVDVQKNAVVDLGSATALTIEGANTTSSDTATVKVSSGNATTITQTTGSAHNLDALTINSTGAANTVTIAANATSTQLLAATATVTATGDKSLTVKSAVLGVDGRTFTDSTTAGTTVLDITGGTAAGAANDLSKVSFDQIKFSGAVHASDTFKFANNANVLVADSLTADLDLATNTGATTITVELGDTNADGTGANVTNSSTAITTINLSASANVSSNFVAGATAAVVVSGTKNITLGATSTAKSISATGLSGVLSVTYDGTSDIATVTGGSGNDVFALTTAAITATIDGGTGTDKITVADNADISGVTFSNIETIDVLALGVTDSKDSQLSGKTMTLLATGGTNETFVINGLTSTTVDLSGITVSSSGFAATNAVILDASAQTLAFNIKGTKGADSISGGTNNDVIDGGTGDDTLLGDAGNDAITGGEGADTITGGGGNDTIVLAENTAKTDKVVFGATFAAGGKDTISGFRWGDVAEGGDLFDFDAMTDGTAIVSNLTAASANQSLSTEGVYAITMGAAINGKDYGGATDFATLFAASGAGKFSTTVDGTDDASVVVVVGTDETHIYHVKATATTLTDGMVDLVGIVTGTGTLVAGNLGTLS